MNERYSMKRKYITAFLLSIGLILVVSTLTGCEFLLPKQPAAPTSTSTQTPIPSPTIDWFPATPTSTLLPEVSPTPKPTKEDQVRGITELLIQDDFSNEGLWITSQSESGNAAFGTDSLTLAVAKSSSSLLSLSNHTLPENFYLEMTVQTTLCDQQDQIGIVLWYQSSSDYYRLLLNCTGGYRLELFQGGQNAVIYDWDSATQMQLSAPATNQISIWVYDGTFQLYINDAFQFETQIGGEHTGRLGVFSRTINGTAMTVRFSDLQIYQVEME